LQSGLELPTPDGRSHDDQYDSQQLHQGLDAQLVRIAVHGGQKQQNAAREERIPQLTRVDISANTDHRSVFMPFLIRYFSVEHPGEGEAGHAMK